MRLLAFLRNTFDITSGEPNEMQKCGRAAVMHSAAH